jgi:hypothetical protein
MALTDSKAKSRARMGRMLSTVGKVASEGAGEQSQQGKAISAVAKQAGMKMRERADARGKANRRP